MWCQNVQITWKLKFIKQQRVSFLLFDCMWIIIISRIFLYSGSIADLHHNLQNVPLFWTNSRPIRTWLKRENKRKNFWLTKGAIIITQFPYELQLVASAGQIVHPSVCHRKNVWITSIVHMKLVFCIQLASNINKKC